MELVKRSEKITYLKVDEEYHRMKGFKALSTSREAKEYERQYVDEDFDRVDVVGMNTTRDFEFDQIKGDAVHELLIDIIEKEKIGTDAVVSLLQVDFSKEGTGEEYPAVERKFAVIPESEGEEFESYGYSGSFKAQDKRVEGTATSPDDFLETAVFVEAAQG